jgi:hypothetical protein
VVCQFPLSTEVWCLSTEAELAHRIRKTVAGRVLA